jgi:hypothetical protein
MALLAELLERDHQVPDTSSPRLARRVAGRLERFGYAGRRHAVGRWWLVPTRAGLRAGGLEYRVWELVKHEWSATHIEACPGCGCTLPPAQLPLLEARLRGARGGDRHQVYPLPKEVDP